MTTEHRTPDLNALRRHIDEMETAKTAQPQEIADALVRRDQLRDDSLVAEPWVQLLRAVPTVDEHGDLTGMMGFPSIDAKELWGCRLAFDLAASDGDPVDVLSDYYTRLHGNIDHLFLVQSAALATLIEGLVRPLLDELERCGSNYVARTNVAKAAENAWSVRLDEDDQ
jgi:hypothetical protein